MEQGERDKLKALIEKKKNSSRWPFDNRKDSYIATGKKRKGVKQNKQGGLFDK